MKMFNKKIKLNEFSYLIVSNKIIDTVAVV